MTMKMHDCFAYMASRWPDDGLLVTSAGHSSGTWWDITHNADRVFYLTASMSLSSMFASGIAVGHPERPVWAFSGDGAFVMNPGMLFVERRMNLPNLKHFMISNQCYGSTEELDISYAQHAEYAAMARAAGIERVYRFSDLDAFKAKFDEAVLAPGHTFIVLDVERVGGEVRTASFDGPELKFKFGRHIEKMTGKKIFTAP
jgi:thiamine pyrophosphate-dependent acetolactate synthase large subunit-like protein